MPKRAKDGSNRGRRSKRDENLIMECLNMGWIVFRKYMEGEASIEDKAKLAAPLIAKTVPTTMRHKHDYQIAYVSAIPRAIEPPTIDITQAAHDAAQEEEGDQ